MNRGDLFKTYDALAAGAVEVFDKPSGEEPDEAWETRLVSLVKLVSRIKVITHPRARLGQHLRGASIRPHPEAPARASTPSPGAESSYNLVAIGTSTGGPNALVEVLSRLPKRFPLPILLVIHIGRPFASGFTEWLASQCSIGVSLAADGTPLPK